MTTAERLTAIANNVPLVYEAGMEAAEHSEPMSDVNFYDYDGRIIASYTLAEAQALTKLPDPPKHKGLVFQGWNWSLEDVNLLTDPMDIGPNYTTDDGTTRVYVSFLFDGIL